MKYKEIFMYVLGAFIVGCCVTAITLLVFYPLPATNHDIVNLGIGSLLTMAGSVVAYFFGSSKGSADKTEIMKEKIEPKTL